MLEKYVMSMYNCKLALMLANRECQEIGIRYVVSIKFHSRVLILPFRSREFETQDVWRNWLHAQSISCREKERIRALDGNFFVELQAKEVYETLYLLFENMERKGIKSEISRRALLKIY